MNLALSKKADYVVKASIALARRFDGDRYLKIREIAAEMAIPRNYTPQILDALIQNGLVESKAGKAGGYRLTRPPERITMLEVLEAGEGSLKAQRCALSEGPCHWENVCPIHNVISEATRRFRETMSGEVLSAVASRDLLLEHGELPTPEEPHQRRDPQKDFPVKSYIGLRQEKDMVTERLGLDDGQWMADLMVEAVEFAIDNKGLGYLFPRRMSSDIGFMVNLGYLHIDGESSSVPITFEASKHNIGLPQFVGTLTLVTSSPSVTHCELAGRIEFSPIIFSGLQFSNPKALDSLHIQLNGLAELISESFLSNIEQRLVAKKPTE